MSLALAPLLLSTVGVAGPSGEDDPGRTADPAEELTELERRAAVLDLGASRVEGFWEDEVAPVEEILRDHGDPELVRTISLALVREGRNVGIDPRALASVLLVENPWLAPDIRSSVGAVGLMQVMPVHAGQWGCASDDLEDIGVNICHGARIFAAYLRRHGGDMDRALLAYNGCVRGTNTPDCHLYPSRVYGRAGRAAFSRWVSQD